jgi:tRNA pseudouridine13 synthase
VTYLADHSTDFRGAIARLRPELQGMYLSAYQSELWNRMLARWLAANIPAAELGDVELHRGRLPVPKRLPTEAAGRWHSLILPLPCARLRPDPAAEWHPLAEAVLAEEGVTMKGLKVPGLNKPFFSKGERRACLRPDGLDAVAAPDELNPGRRKVTLRFELPRGCYATMVVKRLTAESLQCENPSPQEMP